MRTRSRYFFGASLVLLALVFLGFAPTFYLRPFFGRIDPPTGSASLPLTSSRTFGAALQSLLPALLEIGLTTEALLVASLVIFDLVQHRRVFATSVLGAALVLLIRPLWMYLTLHSELGIRWTNWLGRIPT